MRRALLIAGIFLLATAIPVLGQDSTTAKAEVLAAVQKLFDGMRAHDTTAIGQVLDSTSRLVTSFTRDGASAMRARSAVDFIHDVATMASGEVMDERMQNPEVRVEDNMATVWTRYRFYVKSGFSHCGVDVFQLVRTTAGWKIIALAYTIRPAAQCGS